MSGNGNMLKVHMLAHYLSLPLTGKVALYLLPGNCIIAYWQSRQWDGPMPCPVCRRQVCILSVDMRCIVRTP